ncbi:hypothetical protein O181_031209 [Austropuccinia psidii MF-1]|uniref:Uncharacterized protein n=1 Tax=Austropuccinia psidii MF-1 TaxID=1389203 RepID=A0A9Q3CV96_9BASI|nr:hypothetical protein [Austropuccinia psidii MF-1]
MFFEEKAKHLGLKQKYLTNRMTNPSATNLHHLTGWTHCLQQKTMTFHERQWKKSLQTQYICLMKQLDTYSIQPDLGSTCEDEPLVDQQQPSINNSTMRLKVIGPLNPTLITADVDPLQILLYTRRPKIYLTLSEETPSTYSRALRSDNQSAWVDEIEKEL